MKIIFNFSNQGRHIVFLLLVTNSLMTVHGQNTIVAQTPRARETVIPFEGKPGINNSITDVPGILVGYKTKISGSGSLKTGQGFVRTGVTVILPKGRTPVSVTAGWFSLNGDCEMTGTTFIEEYGFYAGPIGIANTNSVGVVRDAIVEWKIKQDKNGWFGLPVVAETYDGMLKDINGLHIKKEDVFDAINDAHGGHIEEGNTGGGTGMTLMGYKGGSGTSSRIFTIDSAKYILGVFVQANFGACR